MDNLLSRVEVTLRKYSMVGSGERILVACSGGPDSVALVYLLNDLVSKLQLKLHLAHFNHALRRGSDADQAFVQKLAHSLKLSFHTAKRRMNQPIPQKGLSVEETARNLRYEFFWHISKKTRITKLALAHHQDDQAETLLMRLLQGTGLKGLQGIRPVVKWKTLTLIRPLMDFSRAEIQKFLKERSLPYRKDPTNRSLAFPRNRIRHELLPILERKYNPHVRQALARLAQTCVAELDGLDRWVKAEGTRFIQARRNGTLRIDRNLFLWLPPMLQFRLLDDFLKRLDSQSGMDSGAWDRMEKGIKAGRFRTTLPKKIDLQLSGKGLILRKT